MTAMRAADRRFVGWLSLAQLVSWGSVFYGFSLLLEPVEAALGLSRSESSLAFSLAMLAEGALAYPVGRWIDRGHERAVMTGGSLLIAACLALHTQITAPWQFHALWLCLGLGMACTLYTPVFAVVTRRFPEDFRRAIITLTFLGGLASTVFIPLIAALMSQWGWRGALWVLAALHLMLCAPLHWRLLRGAPRAAPGAAASATERGSLRQHLRSAPFLLIGSFSVLMMAVTAALPPHMVSLLRESGLPAGWAIALPASIGVIQVLGRMLLFFFEHRLDLHRANRMIPCLIPLGLAALLAARGHMVPALLFVLLYGMGNGMLTIVKGTAIAQYVSRAHVASLNGALGLPTALARAAAPWMLGLLWSHEAGYTYGLAMLLAMSALAVGALWTAQRRALGTAR